MSTFGISVFVSYLVTYFTMTQRSIWIKNNVKQSWNP